MLTGKLVRVRFARTKLIAQYIDAGDRQWLDVAERLLALYRSLRGSTREELEEEIQSALGDNPTQLVHHGLAKLLEDRCEFEVAADHPPDEIRERVFVAAGRQRAAGVTFNRESVLAEAGSALGLSAEQIDRSLFADLKAEQRLIHFEDCTPEQLLDRYNVALAQAILLRSTGIAVRITGEPPVRYRQLMRAIKFHRLICHTAPTAPDTYMLNLDGPMSLFSSTAKYGVQLANFLPWVLQCKRFELTADVRWGAQRKEKQFELSSTHQLRSHLPDYGSYVPKELTGFAESFRKSVKEWDIDDEPELVNFSDGFWMPDFMLRHRGSGKTVGLEVLGFWRRTDAVKLYQRLKREVPGQFVLAVSEQSNIDENEEGELPPGIYRFKRTPLPEEVARLALAQIS